MEIQELKKGDLLIMKGREPDFLYFIKSGSFRVITYEGDRRVELGQIRAGCVIGESVLFNQKDRSATVEALEDSVVTKIAPEEFNNMFSEQHPWLRGLAKTLALRVYPELLKGSVLEA